jgi:outer membrane protein assembly factor BamE (lipoprotein component of BamABCDE complex)
LAVLKTRQNDAKNVVVLTLSLGDWLDVEALEAVRVGSNRRKVRKSLLSKAV